MQKSSTFFPQDFHRISTCDITWKAFPDKGCLEFSTILAFPNFLNIYVDKHISLTFINFCLDKGVHFRKAIAIHKKNWYNDSNHNKSRFKL